jgi:hypothetical protein
MKLSTSSEFFDQVANHPQVFEKIAPSGLERVSFAEAWDSCLGFEFDDGGFIMQCLGGGLYEAHTLFLPGCKDTRSKGMQVLHYMFCAGDCREIVTRIPCDLTTARGFATSLGFVLRGRRAEVFPRAKGSVDVEWLGMTIGEFIAVDPHLPKIGEGFHKRLHDEGIGTNHADDEWHDRYVGYAISCGTLGQRDKGVEIYNRWARYAGFLPLEERDGKFYFGAGNAWFDDGNLKLEAA